MVRGGVRSVGRRSSVGARRGIGVAFIVALTTIGAGLATTYWIQAGGFDGQPGELIVNADRSAESQPAGAA